MTNRIECKLPFGPKAIRVDGELVPFEKSLRLRNHSPTGLSWGYGGSGPAQAALAILLTQTDEEMALKYYMAFKDSYVALWPQRDYEFLIDISSWLKG